MNYSNIKIPFIDKEKIKRKADLFREKFWNDSVPVDIEKIIDVKLEIDIIPLPNLGDAFISSDWKSIYVDQNKYIRNEKQNNRERFNQKIWQKNYYDRIIHNKKELDKIRKYIFENSLKWEIDKNNPENLFM